MSEVVEYSSESQFDLSDYLPDWIYRAIVRDSLPWQEGKKCPFEEFDKTYTFHDSSWVGLFAGIAFNNSLTLGVIWDPYWVPDEVHRSTPIVKDWPFLFVKIDNVLEIDTGTIETIDHSRNISGTEFYRLDDGVRQLVVVCDGGKVKIKYKGKTIFLGLDREGRPLKI